MARSAPAAALLTPPGAGGIAVIACRGAGAEQLVATLFRPRSAPDWLGGAPGRLCYGHVVDGGEVVDEVLVRRAGRGGAEVVEINCHGGVVPAGEVMRLLVEAGASEVPVGELAPGAAREGQGDAIRAEAVRLLPFAETRLAVRMLCDQWNGALSRTISAIDPAAGDAGDRLASLIDSAAFGLALVRPRRAALIGPPNAGKSTLFNALVGHNRTIVSPAPGTTRDFVNESVALGGYPIELIDTAGLRRRGGVIEMKGVEAAWRVASDADLLLIVLDASRGLSAEVRTFVQALADRRPIVAWNKSDLAGGRTPPPLDGDVTTCLVSALTGDRLPDLERAMLDRFPDPAAYPPGSPVVFNEGQAQALTRAGGLCGSEDSVAARAVLADLLRTGSLRGEQ